MTETTAVTQRRPSAESAPISARGVLLPLAVAIYTVVIRTHGISNHFQLLSDQVRDWAIALRTFSALPLVGAPSNGGGNSFGPVYYWLLWASRVVIGPFVGNLPHAGGIGFSIFQSIADGVLCVGIRKASGSWIFAVAVVMLLASAPFDLALSSVIWNPVIAVAFVKLALGLLLFWQERLTRARRLTLFTLAWLAVQAHSPAMPAAIAIFVWLEIASLRTDSYQRALIVLAEGAAVIFVLQLPSAFASASIEPTRVVDVIAKPAQLRIAEAFTAVGDAIETIAAGPFSVPPLKWIVLGSAAAIVARAGATSPIAAATVWPIAFTVLMWSIWRYPYDSYLFLTIIPSAVLMVAWTTRLLPTRMARTISATLLLLFAIAIQKPRIERASQLFRLPAYGALVSGARAVVSRGEPVKGIEAPFVEGTDPEFVFRILGGRMDPAAPVIARITAGGGVTYVR